MTVKALYEVVLTEINKVEAPALLLEDFNYLLNKAILLYCNMQYNLFTISMLIDDNIAPLVRTSVWLQESLPSGANGSFFYTLPTDYWHLTQVLVKTTNLSTKKNCDPDDKPVYTVAARRGTSDSWPQVINNYWMKPLASRPYYFTTNRNASRILEIRVGNDWASDCSIDYLKKPDTVILTPDLLDDVADNSQELEWSDYVCYEIINTLVKLVLENASDQRIGTHLLINQSIMSPGMQQPAQLAAQ